MPKSADIEDLRLILKKNKANRVAFKGNHNDPGVDFRSRECVDSPKQAEFVVTNPKF